MVDGFDEGGGEVLFCLGIVMVGFIDAWLFGNRRGIRREICVGKAEALDVTGLAAVSAEVRRVVIPSRVEVVSQRESHRLVLGVRTEVGRSWLDLSWRAGTGRVCVTQDGPARGTKDDERNFSLGAVLRSSLIGLALVDCRLAAPLERVVRLDFSPRVGTPAEMSVFLELMGGGRSNLVVVDSSTMEIKACGRQVSGRKTKRGLQTGGTYEIPSPPSSVVPSPTEDLDSFVDRLRSLQGETLARALVRTYRGVSPSLSRRLLQPVGNGAGTLLVDEVDDELMSVVFTNFHRWVEAMTYEDDHLFRPRLDENGSLDFLGFGSEEDKTCEEVSVSALVDACFARAETVEEVGNLRKKCLAKLVNLQQYWTSRRDGFQAQTEGEEEAERLRIEGDMIIAFSHTWTPESKQVEVETLDGEKISFHVPENETPITLAQRRHKLSQKKRRAIDKVQVLLEEAQEKVDYYENLQFEAESLGELDLSLAQELEEEIFNTATSSRSSRPANGKVVKGGKKKANPAQQANSRKKNAKKELTTIPVPGAVDAVVIVGRNSRQNDLVGKEQHAGGREKLIIKRQRREAEEKGEW